MHACTIVARNYLAHARTLAASYLEHHPDGRFTVLVLDPPVDGLLREDDGFEVAGLDILGLPADELARMLTLYDVKEFATAVKPTLLQRLLDGGASAAVYLDPDIVVFRPLDQIGRLAQTHGIVLTPHMTEPVKPDGALPDEVTMHVAGIYNLGFVAVGEGGRPFLEWWADRLARDCVEEAEPGLFVDQKWCDFVPAYWDCHVLRDPAWNVAYWNLPTRVLARDGERWLVNGEPLGFFHFSGYSPLEPGQLSKYQSDPPRVTLDEGSDLRALCDDYAQRLVRHGFAECARVPYAFDAPGGVRLDRPVRRHYRAALKAAEAGAAPEPPNPFSHGAHAWVEWLRAPLDPSRPGLSRYLAALHAGLPPLRAAFPDPAGADLPAFLAWVAGEGRLRLRIPPQLLPDPVQPEDERLAGSRSRAVLAFADELVADRELLAGWARTVGPADDATLVILAQGDAERAAQEVVAALAEAGVADDGPDMLLLACSPLELPPTARVAGVYTRRDPQGALLGLPHADDAAALARAA